MKKVFVFAIFLVGLIGGARGQEPPKIHVDDPVFDQTIRDYLKFSTPVLSVNELSQRVDSVLILDTREIEEFTTSHIPGAYHAGYKDFNIDDWKYVPRNTEVVLYCSIGYRSEKISEKFRKEGFENIYNLYGSIFEWANKGFPLEDVNGRATRKLHTYNKKWSLFVSDQVEKTW